MRYNYWNIVHHILLHYNYKKSKLVILGERETLDLLITNQGSIVRFGDGEISLIYGNDIYFQKFNHELSRKLRKIIRADKKDLYIGIPNFDQLKIPNSSKVKMWQGIRSSTHFLLDSKIIYCSSFITRPKGVKGLLSKEYFCKFQTLWNDKKVILINYDPLLANHEFFRNASDVLFITCPKENAYDEYEMILSRSLNCTAQNSIFLISAGPTATVLGYELHTAGRQAIDIGQIIREYDEFYKNQ